MSKIPAKAKHARKSKRRPQFSFAVGQLDDQQILPFQVWCRLNNLSLRTGRRVLASGSGPRVVQLSSHRIGGTYGDNRAWQQRGGFQKTEEVSPAADAHDVTVLPARSGKGGTELGQDPAAGRAGS
jgi:hypothetical protein